eukprot:gene4267-7603_t
MSNIPPCEVCGESPTEKFCNSCENKFQCEDCCSFLHSKKNRKDHTIITYEEWKIENEKVQEVPQTTTEETKRDSSDSAGHSQESEPGSGKYCNSHKKEQLKLYCSKCRKLVCLQCITDEHQGHPCTQLQQAVQPFVDELEDKLENFTLYVEKYENASTGVTKASDKIKQESADLQVNVKKIFETIKTHLDTKEKEIIDSITSRETPRIKILAQQHEALEKEITNLSEQVKLTKELTQSTEDNYQFVVNSLERSNNLDAYEFVELREHPLCNTGDVQHLDFSTIKDAVEYIKLSPPIDFSQTTLQKRSMYASDSTDNKFTVLLKNWDGFPGSLDSPDQLNIVVTECPPESEPYEIIIAENHGKGEHNFIFKAKTIGEYKIKIHWRTYEIKGSPFTISIRSNLGQPVELPSAPNHSATFFLPNEEFWFASKKSVTVYDPKGKKGKSHSLPSKAAYIQTDKLGNIYTSDGEKTFTKYDKDIKVIKQWKISLAKGESVCAITPSTDQSYCFGMLSNGNMLKLFIDNEKESELFVILRGLTSNNGDIIHVENLFIVSDKTVKVFDERGILRQQFTEYTEGATFAIVYDELYACGNDSKTWNSLFLAPDWEKKEEVPKLDMKDAKDGSLKSKSSIFNMSPRKQQKSIQLVETISKIKLQGKLPCAGLKSVDITPLGDFIVTCVKTEEYEGIDVWEYSTGKKVKSIKNASAYVATNGMDIITIGTDNKVHIWNFDDGAEKLSFDVEQDVTCFTPTATLKKIICGHSNGKLNSYDIKNPDVVKNMGKHGECIHCVFASKDGRFILSGSSDGTIKVWGADGTDLQTLKGHSGSVTSVTMTDDGKYILSGGSDRSLRVWLSETYKNVKTIKGAHKDSITSLKVTPNGTYVVSTCSNSPNVKMHKIESGNEKLNISVGKKEKNVGLAVDGAGAYFTTVTESMICIFQNVKYQIEGQEEESKKNVKQDKKLLSPKPVEKQESKNKINLVIKEEEKDSIENWLNE